MSEMVLSSSLLLSGAANPSPGPWVRRMKRLAVLALALGLCVWSCANLNAGQASRIPPRTAIYQRATNEFAEACFFKPAEPKTNDLPATLAPLILQQIDGRKGPLDRLDRFGVLSLSNGVPALDLSHPAVYWHADTVQLNGKVHLRLAYLWCYALAPGTLYRGKYLGCAGADTSGFARMTSTRQPVDALSGRPAVLPAGLPLQGIRITLNSAGQPAIWEVLADTSGVDLIFVSQNLEAAAVAEFGKPLPGRRYAIERRVDQAPKVIVARVIDDGPVAMGPILYLSAGTRAVSTIICRCMPAQAKRLVGTSTYDLWPFQPTPGRPLLTQVRALARERTAFWPGDAPSENRLEHCLRLPSAF